MSKKIDGGLQVSNQVIADLAGYAAMTCYGVVGVARPDMQKHLHLLMQIGQLRNGVDVESTSEGVSVRLHVVVEQGVNLRSVSDNLKSSVKFMLEKIAEIDNLDVDVVIEGIKVR